jgi:hypothetical protein
MSGSEDNKPVVFPYQRIRDNPSTRDLGQPSGAATDPDGYIAANGPPEDDLVDIFRWMLDIGTTQYEHDLVDYIHSGYPSLVEHYESCERLGRGHQQECDIEDCNCHYAAGHGKWHNPDPEREALEAKYFEEQLKEKERRIRITDKIKTLRVTNKEELGLLTNPNPKINSDFDYRCYNQKCDFATNYKAEYERHGVTKHTGKPCYPGKADLWLYGWKPQGRKWEV